MHDQLLIVGASGRAAAWSARRAGFIPSVLDAFGDDDTRRIADCRVAPHYPSDLLAAAEPLPLHDWIYVGGLENSPAIVDRLATRRRLLGIGGAALLAVRDPHRLRTILCGTGIGLPEICDDPAPLPRDGTWLRKSRRSAGGLGVGVFGKGRGTQIDPHRYYEQKISGRSCGFTFLGDGRDARLVGAAEQWTADGDPRHPFLFGGALVPVMLPAHATAQVEASARCLVRELGLRGLFGIDTVIDDNSAWLLEVNPRYTATVELLEQAYDLALLADHVRACRDERLPSWEPPPARACVGKQIVYAAARPSTVSAEFNALLWTLRGDGPVPLVADIPQPASTIPPYAPLVTVFASGDDTSSVRGRLHNLAAEIRDAFLRMCPAP